MNVEEDGDEIFVHVEHCYGCRLGFHNDKPVYAPLAPKNGFLCCTVCGASYGPVLQGCWVTRSSRPSPSS